MLFGHALLPYLVCFLCFHGIYWTPYHPTGFKGLWVYQV